ncbi:MAG: hypothetical protein AAGF90_00820 [Pseudomonadota bacterium]
MLPYLLAAVGFALGWTRAARRGGGRADKWQYAIGHAVALGLLGMLLATILIRFGLFPAGGAA